MSFEAIAWARKVGSTAPYEEKWLTVPTDDRAAAREAFAALGLEVRGFSILNQAEATAAAARI